MLNPAYHVSKCMCDRHRELNYKICTAVDLTKMTIVLSEMVKDGMEPELAEIFKAQSYVLLASIQSENNRIKRNKQRTNATNAD